MFILLNTVPRGLVSQQAHIYRWDRQGRKGQLCLVLVRGTMNSCLVKFEDGYTMVTSRNALKLRWPFLPPPAPGPRLRLLVKGGKRHILHPSCSAPSCHSTVRHDRSRNYCNKQQRESRSH
jgi:hypothetical protein